MTKTVKALIMINVFVFLFVNVFKAFSIKVIYLFGMAPQLVLKKFMIWQFITYMFVHVDFWHLFINMLMLWFFGPAIEQAWGRNRFLTFYFFTGIGAALCSLVLSYNSIIIGASGAIFGLLVAYAMMFPETIILVFFILPMKIKYAVFLFAGIELWMVSQSPGDGIAHFAHLGGALFGYLYLKSGWLRRQLAYISIDSFKDWRSSKNKQRQQLSQEEFNRRVDIILDKISKHGMDSLTKEERRILDKRSKMSNQ